jgi:hypothetical protein
MRRGSLGLSRLSSDSTRVIQIRRRNSSEWKVLKKSLYEGKSLEKQKLWRRQKGNLITSIRASRGGDSFVCT